MKLFSPTQPNDTTIRAALDALHQQDKGTLAMTDEGLVDLSVDLGPSHPIEPLDADEKLIEAQMQTIASKPLPAAYNAVTSSAWRMLEEQRQRALDVVRECDTEIAKWTDKRDDAQRAAAGCFAGQTAMEG